MTTLGILKVFKNYQKAAPNGRKKKAYLNAFVSKMIYRTTKTENPETTKQMVNSVLNKSQ